MVQYPDTEKFSLLCFQWQYKYFCKKGLHICCTCGCLYTCKYEVYVYNLYAVTIHIFTHINENAAVSMHM